MSGIAPTLILGVRGLGGGGGEWKTAGFPFTFPLFSNKSGGTDLKIKNVRESSKGAIVENSRVNGAPTWLLGG